mmetsp:Transcript_10130/g.27606  ORF Transcript_10130/g.27606 Transcript_10130/m.27606 type:complete len:300 (-) Transcript_10130:1839-2738(-)
MHPIDRSGRQRRRYHRPLGRPRPCLPSWRQPCCGVSRPLYRPPVPCTWPPTLPRVARREPGPLSACGRVSPCAPCWTRRDQPHRPLPRRQWPRDPLEASPGRVQALVLRPRPLFQSHGPHFSHRQHASRPGSPALRATRVFHRSPQANFSSPRSANFCRQEPSPRNRSCDRCPSASQRSHRAPVVWHSDRHAGRRSRPSQMQAVRARHLACRSCQRPPRTDRQLARPASWPPPAPGALPSAPPPCSPAAPKMHLPAQTRRSDAPGSHRALWSLTGARPLPSWRTRRHSPAAAAPPSGPA